MHIQHMKEGCNTLTKKGQSYIKISGYGYRQILTLHDKNTLWQTMKERREEICSFILKYYDF